MNNFNRRLYAATATVALVAFSTAPSYADSVITTPDLLVTGAAPLPTKEVSSSYTIISSADIAAHQYKTVAEALNAVPGIHLVQQGGQGKLASVFSRGTNSNETLVLMNGQNISDPSTPAGAFNFADLTLDNVERIEVVRGPQSSLYGSQAMGAVINIITKTGGGSPTTTARVEGGTLGTINTSLNSGGSIGKVNYFATIARQATDGSDITPKRYRGTAAEEKDGYENLTGSLKLGADLSENLSASIFGQFVDAHTDLDTQLPENLNNSAKTQALYMNGEIRGSFFCDVWKPVLGIAYTRSHRKDLDHPDIYTVTTGEVENQGERLTFSFDNTLQLVDWNTLSFGANFTREEFTQHGFTDFGFGFIQSPNSSARETAKAFYLADHINFGEQFFATASVRHDSPEKFTGKTTYAVAPGYYIPETDTKLTASLSTGFKVPALFERFGFTPNSFGSLYFGNPNLKPEESRSWEVGFDQGFMDRTVNVGGTYFWSRIDNAISTIFLPTFDSTTVNTPAFRARGVEAYVQVTPTTNLDLRADYTFTVVDADRVVAAMSRRPRHKVNVSAVWRPDSATTLSAETQFVSPYLDVKRDTGALFKPGSYTVVNIAASHRVNDWIELTFKVNNLLDREYDPADGFTAAGIEALGGVAITF